MFQDHHPLRFAMTTIVLVVALAVRVVLLPLHLGLADHAHEGLAEHVHVQVHEDHDHDHGDDHTLEDHAGDVQLLRFEQEAPVVLVAAGVSEGPVLLAPTARRLVGGLTAARPPDDSAGPGPGPGAPPVTA